MITILAKVIINGISNTRRDSEPSDLRATIIANNCGYVSKTTTLNTENIMHGIETIVTVAILYAEVDIYSFWPGKIFYYGENECIGKGKVLKIIEIELEDDIELHCDSEIMLKDLIRTQERFPNIIVK